jgi:hypothetical protein
MNTHRRLKFGILARLRTPKNSPVDCFSEKQVNEVNWLEGCRKFFSWSERPLCKHKARVKEENLLPSQRSQKLNSNL